jgi:ribosome-binding protein aMBF1 (putative translation factor)
MRKSHTQMVKTEAKNRLARKKKEIGDLLLSRNKKLCRKLRAERLLLGMTQSDVARKFGRDQTFISKIEKGIRLPSFVEVERLASIYRMSVAELWHFSRLRV